MVLNLSKQPLQVKIDGVDASSFEELFSKQKVKEISTVQMAAWGYQVFIKKS